MKKHAIIPIFIPHRGCPNDCVFCNQRKITARTDYVTPEDTRKTIEEWLTTLADVETVEIAFYGGSFTGLEIEEQSSFLAVALEYKDAGRISKIHLSTRPDYIDREILDNLRKFRVDTVELGVQSFDDEVLRKSNRGHTSEQVYKAVELLKEYGFEFGIQLMIGLPGDSLETCIESARITAELKPSLTRLYPTIVLDDTELKEMYLRGEYEPLSREEAVERCKEMYKILESAGITIMRVGLKSTDIIGEGGAINGGTYHPAFRQFVESAIARERIEPELAKVIDQLVASAPDEIATAADLPDRSHTVDIFSNEKWFSNMIGQHAENKKYFGSKYVALKLKFHKDEKLADGEFRVELAGN